MKEIWKPIKNYEELYEVSNMGRVRSLPRKTTKGKILKPHIQGKNGYSYVSLCKCNIRCTKRVHVLVLNTFMPLNKKDGFDKNYVIDHKDGNKQNNRLQNLEWVTQKENIKRMTTHNMPAKKVIDLTTNKVFESEIDAAISVGGKRSDAISNVCYGKKKSYKGHKFSFM